MKTKKIISRMVSLTALALVASTQAATLYTESFGTITGTSDFTSIYPDFTYAEVQGGSNVRSQNSPFNNGGTAFLAGVSNDEQTLVLNATQFGGTAYDTTVALSLNADIANNWGSPVSGLVLRGATSDFLVAWIPGATTYKAGTWAGVGNGLPTGTVNGDTLTGSASFPDGDTLAPVNLSVIENGTNYDITLTVGGSANTFSVAIASLGAIDAMGYYSNTKSADGGAEGNTNIDTLTFTGEVVSAPPAAPTIESFTASPLFFAPGGATITLNWETTDATALSIDQGLGDLTGTNTATHSATGTTTYVLTASNGIGTTTASVTVREVAPGSQPNILLFLVDDMGWQDTELQLHNPRPVWNDLYHTPSMLRLAEQGMKFTDAYAASPVCSPTRTGIMSGQNPARTHITDWTRQTGGGGNSNTYLKSPAWRSQGLQPGDGFITLPSLLQAAGYRTIHVGKAHFGGRNLGGGNDPTNLGFDVNIGGSEIGGPYSYFSPWINNPGLYPNMEDQPQGKYITKALTDKAKGAINDALAAGQPFFMNMAHYAVHAPLQGDPEFTVNPEYAGRPGEEIHYAAMVESMDESLGDLLDHLVAIGAADNTIVLFVSDNGGLSSHSRSFSGDPWIRDWHNAPIRSGKGAGYEGGYRVPMIVAWAGQDPAQPPLYSSLAIAPGSTCNEPVHTDDFYPTILTLAGVDVPQPYGQNLDGQDLSPLFKNEPFERDGVLLWHYPHQWYENIGVGLGIEPFTAIRDGDWKLIYFYADGVADGSGYEPRWELYNLTLDIDESNNRATAEPVRLAQMARAMVRELDGMDAQYPISISSNQPVPPTMPVAAGLDADGDGLDDNTEDPNQNGLVDSGETDPDNDNTDGDGTPDGAEIRIGTNPLDPDSFFRLVGEWDGALEITWPSAPGASFTIHSSDNLTNWTGIVTNGLPASSGTTTSYNLGAPGNDQGFYRIELED